MLVTSRRQLADVDGARLLPLDPLSAAEATTLLGQLAGEARIAAEPDAVSELVTACGRMPLAVRIAGAKLAARPGTPVAALARAVATERERLNVLQVGDLSARASIASGYEVLSARGQRAFSLLGLLGPCDVADWVVAALLDEPTGAAVDELVDRSMLLSVGADITGQPRFRLHDLLRDYACEQAAGLPEDERRTAVRRAHQGWLQLAGLASEQLPLEPFFPAEAADIVGPVPPAVASRLTARPDAWFVTERLNLLSLTEQLCAADELEMANQLALTHARFHHSQDRHDDATLVWQPVEECAARLGDTVLVTRARLRIAAGLLGRGSRAASTDRATVSCPGEVKRSLEECIEALESFGDTVNLAFALYWRGSASIDHDDPASGTPFAERGAKLAHRIGHKQAEVINLKEWAYGLTGLGKHKAALAVCERAVEIASEVGLDSLRGTALHTLRLVCTMTGQNDRALGLAGTCLDLFQRMGDSGSVGLTWGVSGDAYYTLGQYAEAVTAYRHALAIFRERGMERFLAVCLYRLACSLHALGRLDEALPLFGEAAPIFASLDLAERAELAWAGARSCVASDERPLTLRPPSWVAPASEGTMTGRGSLPGPALDDSFESRISP